MSREASLVELVDPTGQATGAATVQAVHTAPGQLHRAFSVLLFDPDGRLLVQQRAAVKTRFPLRWANACCGHPAPGETAENAAARRLWDEIGVLDVALDRAGVYLYRAADPATTRVEYEYDHVLLGSVAHGVALTLDPTEVAAVSWVTPAELSAALRDQPEAYAPWLAGVLAVGLTGTRAGAPGG
jgi:isopentenyl-diphosphate delta-isomerase